MGGLQKMFKITYKFYWIFKISSVTNNKGYGAIYLPNYIIKKFFAMPVIQQNLISSLVILLSTCKMESLSYFN